MSMHTYAPRPIRFAGVRRREAWRIKLYAIAHDGSEIDAAAFSRGLDLAWAALPQPAVTVSRPGLGFCVQHHGRGADYVVVAWWDRENELPIRVFVRPAGERGWRPARGGESVCVWDLQVVAFERDAYVSTLLADPPAPADDYLDRFLTAEPTAPARRPARASGE